MMYIIFELGLGFSILVCYLYNLWRCAYTRAITHKNEICSHGKIYDCPQFLSQMFV